VDGSDLQQVTSDSAEDRHPTWTPEGTRLLFDRTDVDPRGRPVLTLMGADGSGRKQLRVDASVGVMRADGSETQLVLPSLAASGPVWSPDGARLAFTRTDGSPRVYVVTLATSDTVALSGGVVTDWVP
jgi:TolB protein